MFERVSKQFIKCCLKMNCKLELMRSVHSHPCIVRSSLKPHSANPFFRHGRLQGWQRIWGRQGRQGRQARQNRRQGQDRRQELATSIAQSSRAHRGLLRMWLRDHLHRHDHFRHRIITSIVLVTCSLCFVHGAFRFER